MKALKLCLHTFACLMFLAARAQAQSIYGNALLFNFSVANQFVTVSNFGNIIPTNEITVEFWANPSQFAAQSAFMLSPDANSNRFNAHIDYGTTSGLTYWDFGNISTGGRVSVASPANSVQNWTHYALVASQSGNYMAVYTNGVLQVSQSGMTPFVRGNYNLQIAGPGYPFVGYLDEFRVWSVARTSAQIQADIYSELSGSESNLVLYYKFDSSSGSVAINSATATGAAYNGILTNSPGWFSSSIPLTVSVVSNTADSGPGSLRDAVANASSGGIITFAPALSGQAILLTNGPIVLGNNVTIDGGELQNGIRIDSNFKSSIFNVFNGTMVLNSLTFTNGDQLNTHASGGAIQNNYGTVTVNNCIFANCAAYNEIGGAIANLNGTMTVNNSSFTGCYADYLGVQTSSPIGGGAIGNQSGHLTVNGCSFIGNSAAQAAGGAILNTGSFPITANNCTFFGNLANNGGGGGAIADQSGNALAVNNCTFYGNSATNTGGGGVYTSGNLNLTNCIICSNLANTGAEVYCGGFLALINPLVTSVSSGSPVPSLIYYHTGLATSGEVDTPNPLLAPLANYGGPTLTLLPLPGSPAINAGANAVTNFLGADQRGLPRKNGANVDIGAVEVQPADTSTVVTTTGDCGSGSLRLAALLADLGASNRITFASLLSGQTVLLTGGQIILTSNLTIDASSLANSVQINGNNQSRIFAITNNVTVVLNSLTITNGNDDNDPTYGGGGILNFGTLTISKCIVTGNQATNNNRGGGGILNQAGQLTVKNSTISRNTADGSTYGGGGIDSFQGTLTVSNSTLSANTANSSVGGGGIDNFEGPMTVYNSTITGNQANNSGSGGGISANGNVTLYNCTITDNTASTGGGISSSYLASTSVMTFWNTIVFGNSASSATEINFTQSLVLTNCLVGPEAITSSSVNNSGSYDDLGDYHPGTYSSSGTLAGVNALLAPLGNYGGPTQTMPPEPGSPAIGAGNVTAASGLTTDQRGAGFARVVGGKVDIGSVEIQSTQSYSIVENNLDAGPGSLRQVISNAPNNATITFDPSLGGQTITLTGGQIVITNALAIDGSSGGLVTNGIQINGNGSSRIFQVNTGGFALLGFLTFTNGNAGSAHGGAILVLTNGALDMLDCTLAGNTSTAGGAIENGGATALIDCTVVKNQSTGNGGAIDNNQGPLEMIQCTVVGNSASGNGGGIANYLNTCAITNCIIASNSSSDTFNFSSSTINFGGTNILSSVSSQGGSTENGTSSLIHPAPLLASLGNYGGLTATMPPLPGSPAIDGGSSAAIASLNISADQRGYPRFSGQSVDIGAVEVQAASAPFLLEEFSLTTNGAVQFSLTNSPYGSFTVFASTNVAAPFNTWSNLGPAIEMPSGSGQYYFTDTHATNFSCRFYRVSSP